VAVEELGPSVAMLPSKVMVVVNMMRVPSLLWCRFVAGRAL
jgi:hypothetical protein